MRLSFDELLIQAKSGFTNKAILDDEISFTAHKLHQYLVTIANEHESLPDHLERRLGAGSAVMFPFLMMLHHRLSEQDESLVDGLDKLHDSVMPLFEKAMDDPESIMEQFLTTGGELINNGAPGEPVDMSNISYRYTPNYTPDTPTPPKP